MILDSLFFFNISFKVLSMQDDDNDTQFLISRFFLLKLLFSILSAIELRYTYCRQLFGICCNFMKSRFIL